MGPNIIKMELTFPFGVKVEKYVEFIDSTEDYAHLGLQKLLEEAWRDYLYARFGDDWLKHDLSPPNSRIP